MNNADKNACLIPRGRAEMVRWIIEKRQPVGVVAAGLAQW